MRYTYGLGCQRLLFLGRGSLLSPKPAVGSDATEVTIHHRAAIAIERTNQATNERGTGFETSFLEIRPFKTVF